MGRRATAEAHGDCAPSPWSLRAAGAVVVVALALSLHALLNALVLLQENVSAAALVALGSVALLAFSLFLARCGAPRLRRPSQRHRSSGQPAPVTAQRRPTLAVEC